MRLRVDIPHVKCQAFSVLFLPENPFYGRKLYFGIKTEKHLMEKSTTRMKTSKFIIHLQC